MLRGLWTWLAFCLHFDITRTTFFPSFSSFSAAFNGWILSSCLVFFNRLSRILRIPLLISFFGSILVFCRPLLVKWKNLVPWHSIKRGHKSCPQIHEKRPPGSTVLRSCFSYFALFIPKLVESTGLLRSVIAKSACISE